MWSGLLENGAVLIIIVFWGGLGSRLVGRGLLGMRTFRRAAQAWRSAGLEVIGRLFCEPGGTSLGFFLFSLDLLVRLPDSEGKPAVVRDGIFYSEESLRDACL